MSSPLTIPFNHQPISTSVKTSSYTIPAGNYARASVFILGTGTFTIDGLVACGGVQNTVLASDNLKLGTTSLPGALITAASDSGYSTGGAFTEATDLKPIVAEYWLPTGTVVSGSGTWAVTIELYNMIT